MNITRWHMEHVALFTRESGTVSYILVILGPRLHVHVQLISLQQHWGSSPVPAHVIVYGQCADVAVSLRCRLYGCGWLKRVDG